MSSSNDCNDIMISKSVKHNNKMGWGRTAPINRGDKFFLSCGKVLGIIVEWDFISFVLWFRFTGLTFVEAKFTQQPWYCIYLYCNKIEKGATTYFVLKLSLPDCPAYQSYLASSDGLFPLASWRYHSQSPNFNFSGY